MCICELKKKRKKKADRQSDGQFVFLLTVWPGRKKSIDSTYPVPVRVLKRLERKTQLSSMCIYICVCVLLISIIINIFIIMYCFFSGRERLSAIMYLEPGPRTQLITWLLSSLVASMVSALIHLGLLCSILNIFEIIFCR